MDRTASTEPQCLYSRAILLLPLWTVQPLQNLSACTIELYFYCPYETVQPSQSLSACTVQLYLYCHYGPYSLYRVSVPGQYS